MPLIQLLESNPAAIRQMNIEQIVAIAGDGHLRDSTSAQQELQAYLRTSSVALLESYATHCLNSAFESSGFVLQDIVNELGRRLEYVVRNGRYHGTSKSIGWDGIWQDPKGYTIVLEVKTSDAYRIKLDTIAKFRETLLQSGEILNPSAVLIVVGRTDTGELEAQVRGSRHAWDTRLISVEALINLVKVKESTDNSQTVEKIRRLLAPLEYTRLDLLVDTVFTTTQDVESAIVASDSPQQSASNQEPLDDASSTGYTPDNVIQDVRERSIAALGKRIGAHLVKKSRALYWNTDRNIRAACTVSKRYNNYGGMKYWYAFHPKWQSFISDAEYGYFVLGCTEPKIAVAIPANVIESHLTEFHITGSKESDYYYHIKLFEDSQGNIELQLPKSNKSLPVTQYILTLDNSDFAD